MIIMTNRINTNYTKTIMNQEPELLRRNEKQINKYWGALANNERAKILKDMSCDSWKYRDSEGVLGRGEIEVPTRVFQHIYDLMHDPKGKKSKSGGNLEGSLNMMIISLCGFIFGLFFLSSKMTGFAIANLTTKTSSIIGASLFVLGIIGFYFYFKKKEK